MTDPETLWAEPMLSVDEAAVQLRRSPQAVLRLIASHRLGAFKVGRAYRIPQSEVTCLVVKSFRPRVLP